jgi:hypothetical protein
MHTRGDDGKERRDGRAAAAAAEAMEMMSRDLNDETPASESEDRSTDAREELMRSASAGDEHHQHVVKDAPFVPLTRRDAET